MRSTTPRALTYETANAPFFHFFFQFALFVVATAIRKGYETKTEKRKAVNKDERKEKQKRTKQTNKQMKNPRHVTQCSFKTKTF